MSIDFSNHREKLATLSFRIKQEAIRIGFSACGISRVRTLDKEARFLEQWLREHKHGKMQYMENYFDKRINPAQLVEGAKSVISVLKNYYPAEDPLNENSKYKISKYAYGIDYHFVVKEQLSQLLDFIQQEVGTIHARCFVDSAPVMDKVWAKYAGLGWIGKNTNLISPKHGSFFFIGEIILDLPLAEDHAIKDYCGRCNRCIEACPTEALSPYQIDATKCISYLTIELKEQILPPLRSKLSNWIFGCDICQDVCPWNRFASKTKESSFSPLSFISNNNNWSNLDKPTFKKLIKQSAIQRIKYEKFIDNLKANQEQDLP